MGLLCNLKAVVVHSKGLNWTNSNALKAFNRQALHSNKLTLRHPETGDLMSWSIEPPKDMRKLLDALSNFDS